MKHYIETKLVSAERAYKCMSSGKMISSNDITEDEVKKKNYEDGYSVVYVDGHKSWLPKEIFEKSHLEVNDNPKLPSGVSIGPEMVKSFIKNVEVATIGNKTTLVKVTLMNDFEIIESSACVDEANYNQDIGVEVCMEKVQKQIWLLLGFLLQTAFKGVK